MLHNAVVLYRRTIAFSYIVSTNQSRVRIPTVRWPHTREGADQALGRVVQVDVRFKAPALKALGFNSLKAQPFQAIAFKRQPAPLHLALRRTHPSKGKGGGAG